MKDFILLVSGNLVFSSFSGHTKHVEPLLIKDQILSINRLNMLSYKFHPQVLANVHNELIFLESLCDDIVLGFGVKSVADKFLLFVLGKFL